MTLDETLQQAADLRAAERATQWAMADLCSSAIGGRRGDPVTGALAEVWGCSKEWVLRLRRMAEAFPHDSGLRFPDVPFGVYQVAIRAVNPQDALRQAVEGEWNSAELGRRLGIGPGGATGDACPTCGRRIPRRKRHHRDIVRS